MRKKLLDEVQKLSSVHYARGNVLAQYSWFIIDMDVLAEIHRKNKAGERTPWAIEYYNLSSTKYIEQSQLGYVPSPLGMQTLEAWESLDISPFDDSIRTLGIRLESWFE